MANEPVMFETLIDWEDRSVWLWLFCSINGWLT